jgi:hypothetical protein
MVLYLAASSPPPPNPKNYTKLIIGIGCIVVFNHYVNNVVREPPPPAPAPAMIFCEPKYKKPELKVK